MDSLACCKLHNRNKVRSETHYSHCIEFNMFCSIRLYGNRNAHIPISLYLPELKSLCRCCSLTINIATKVTLPVLLTRHQHRN